MSKNKPYFDEVNSRVNFPEMEKEILNKWYEDGVVAKYLKKNDSSKKRFSFLDGPITANNPMGVHHGWGRTYKDLWQKYKNLKGFKQRFQNGFDAQGLWVEVEVEKDLGFKNKKEIEKYGIAEFVQKCKSRVIKYSIIQTEQSKRLGNFMDWENSYYTMSDANNYMIWHFLKVCYENDWIYKGKDSVPWCPRCETAISQHEMLTEDYKEVTHKAIYFELPVNDKKDEYLLVWTTTPWTIPANIAVAVDTKLKYSLVKGDSGDKFWLAKDAIKRVFGSEKGIIKTVSGGELVGLKYKGPFDELPAVRQVAQDNENFHSVIATDERIMPITAAEGTGIVHTAVSAGSEDFKLGKKLDLPMIPVIADDATYLEGLGFLTGKNAKKNPGIILDYLVEEDKKDGVNWVFQIENYKHRYPACWRCKTELVWKVTDEWYIAMDNGSPSLRERMKRVTKSMNWIPDFGLKRELDWLNNMHDWLISKKNRYWGLALPIWECTECGNFEVIGSKEELEKKAIEGWDEFEDKSPHKPQIDKVKIKCSKCGNKSSRIEPVGNPWLDAGIVPFSTISADNKSSTLNSSDKALYLKDKEKWSKWFPADFITESFPGQFKNWFYSLIAMSTVLENSHPTNTILGFATLLDEKGKPMHKSTGNMIEFNKGANDIGVDVMRWMYARQNVSENLLFGYEVANEVRRKFHLKLWNIYNFFVTFANVDAWEPKDIKNLDDLEQNTLDTWIVSRFNETLKKVTEELDSYNAMNPALWLEEFVDDFSNWYIRRSRDRVGPTAVNAEDKENFYQVTHFLLVNLSKVLSPFTPYITESIYTNLTKEESVHLSNWPEAGDIDKTLLENMKIVRSIVEKGHSERKQAQIPVRQPLSELIVVSQKLDRDYEELIKDELNIKKISWEKGGEFEVKLDTNITKELEDEAKVREMVRLVQKERRNQNTSLDQEIELTLPWIPKSEELKENLKQKVLAVKLHQGDEIKVKPI